MHSDGTSIAALQVLSTVWESPTAGGQGGGVHRCELTLPSARMDHAHVLPPAPCFVSSPALCLQPRLADVFVLYKQPPNFAKVSPAAARPTEWHLRCALHTFDVAMHP